MQHAQHSQEEYQEHRPLSFKIEKALRRSIDLLSCSPLSELETEYIHELQHLHREIICYSSNDSIEMQAIEKVSHVGRYIVKMKKMH